MAGNKPCYALVGRGRWGKVIHQVLAAEQRRTVFLEEARRRPAEGDVSYRSRLGESMAGSGAHIAWLCIPPGPDIPLMMEAAILAGLHVIVEKPWLCPEARTGELIELARTHRAVAGIHFQYCFLEEVERLRLSPRTAEELKFGGCFTLSRPDRLGIAALDNLGSHLLAVREYAVPDSEVSEIRCGYGLVDERSVRIEADGETIALINLATGEPIIQRFVAKFEGAILLGEFPLDLRFAMRVSSALNAVRSG